MIVFFFFFLGGGGGGWEGRGGGGGIYSPNRNVFWSLKDYIHCFPQVTAVFLFSGARASIFTLGSSYRAQTANPGLRKGSFSACSGNLIRAFKAWRDNNNLEVACNGTRTDDLLASECNKISGSLFYIF